MKPACGDARNNTALTMSDTLPRRPRGICSVILARNSGVVDLSPNGVSTVAGQTQFTLIWEEPKSAANARVIPVADPKIVTLFEPPINRSVVLVVLVNEYLLVQTFDHSVNQFFPDAITCVLTPNVHCPNHACLAVHVGTWQCISRSQPRSFLIFGHPTNSLGANMRCQHLKHFALFFQALGATAHDAFHGHRLHCPGLTSHQRRELMAKPPPDHPQNTSRNSHPG